MIPGLAGGVDLVGDHELVSEFLIQEWPFEDEAAAPLELLKADRVDERCREEQFPWQFR